MVRCIVTGCKWSKKKIPVDETMPRLLMFPKDKKMFDEWAVKIGKDMPKDPRICIEHFEEDQFEVDMKEKLLHGKEKLVLKSSAIPTKLPNRKEPKRRSSSIRRAEISAKKQCVVEALNDAIIDKEIDSSNVCQGTQCSIDKEDFSSQYIYRRSVRSKGIQCCTFTSDKSTQTIDELLSSTINDDSLLSTDDQATLEQSDNSFNLFDDCDSLKSEDLSIPYSAFIVFWSSLMILLKRCIRCGDLTSIISYCYNGTMIKLSLLCRQGHQTSWSSQPENSSGNAEGNIRIAAGILFSGNTFTRIAETFSFANIRFFTDRTFHRYQQRFIFPVVNEKWISWVKTKSASLKKLDGNKVTGDGRCDSPGHSAKYCTYSFMDQTTNEIIDFNVMQVTEATSSNAMEKACFVKLLNKIEKEGVKVSQITTDRHPQVRKYMREKRKDIVYQFDVWHVAKSLFKKLQKASKKKPCQSLECWIPSIRNHLWWSCATCNGDFELLKEKWLSILHHIKDEHSWDSGMKYTKCCHPPLSDIERKTKPWLKASSEAFKALQQIVCDTKFLKDLEHLTQYSHTGNLEVYHALINKYAPKRQHFSYRGMICRTQLAALDHNAGVNLSQAETKTGKLRHKLVFPKLSNRWTIKAIKEHKNKQYVHEMVERVIQCCNNNIILEESYIPSIPRNISTIPRPNKNEAIESHKSRFS